MTVIIKKNIANTDFYKDMQEVSYWADEWNRRKAWTSDRLHRREACQQCYGMIYRIGKKYGLTVSETIYMAQNI